MNLQIPTPFIIWAIPFVFLALYFIKPLKNAFAINTLENGTACFTATLSRMLLTTLVITLPLAYDLYVPEVSGDIRWYMMHSFAGVLLTLMLINIYKQSSGEKLSIKLPLAGWATLVITLTSALTLIWSISLPSSLWFFKHMMAYIIIFTSFIYFRHDKWFNNLAWIFALGAGFNGLVGICQFLNITDASLAKIIPFVDNVHLLDYFRQAAPPAGTMSNKNLAASFLVITLPVTLYLLFASKKISAQIVAATCFTLGTTLLLYTRSRGSWIAAVTAIIFLTVWLLLNKEQWQAIKAEISKSKVIAFAASLIVIVGFAQLDTKLHKKYHSISNSISEQTATLFNLGEGDIGARMAYNLNGLQIIAENPWGTGLATFHTIYPKYNKAIVETPHYGYNLGARPRRAHNDLLQAFIELGVVGGLGYLSLFASMFMMTWRMAKNKNIHKDTKLFTLALSTGIFALGVNCLGDFPLQMPMAPFVIWSFMGIVTALYLMHHKPKLKGFNCKFAVPKGVYAGLAVVAILVTACVAYDDAKRRESTTYLKYAMALTYAGNNNDYAYLYIEKASEIYPFNSRTLEIRSVINSGHGKSKPNNIQIPMTDRATAVLEHLKYDPYAQNSLINVGYLYLQSAQQNMQNGKKKDASSNVAYAHYYAQKAIEVSSREHNAYELYGLTLESLNKLDESLKAYNEALKRNPRAVHANAGKQRVLNLLRQQKEQSAKYIR